jgi:hypothetical protein
MEISYRRGDGSALDPLGVWLGGRMKSFQVAGEPVPGHLVLGVEAADGPGAVVATDFGTSERLVGLVPIAWPASSRRPAPGSLGARLFLDRKGALVRYDPETRTRTVLLGPGRN